MWRVIFRKNCDADFIINRFFTKFKEVIKGDTEYISYKIKKLVEEDRVYLMKINGDGKDYLNRIGKVSYIRHYVVPEKWRQRVLYLLHKFIYLVS